MKSGIDRIGRTVPVERAVRSCLAKRRYDSKTEARDKAARYFKYEATWKELRPYKCGLCGGWHLTSATQTPGGKILTTRKMP